MTKRAGANRFTGTSRKNTVTNVSFYRPCYASSGILKLIVDEIDRWLARQIMAGSLRWNEALHLFVPVLHHDDLGGP